MSGAFGSSVGVGWLMATPNGVFSTARSLSAFSRVVELVEDDRVK